MTGWAYRLWSKSGSDWCNFDIVGEKSYGANIRALLPPDWDGRGTEVRRDFELVPEPDNPHSPSRTAISVRADNHTVGYIPSEHSPAWAGVVRRVVASGYIPVVPGRVYAFMAKQWDLWDGDGAPPTEFAATVKLKLDDPASALPINNPPEVPYTMLPRSGVVQVTKEELHSDTLCKQVPDGGYGAVFATLHERDASSRGATRSVVEVRIDDECVGQLTTQTGQKFLPLIRHLHARGLVTTCWGDITGSVLAAEVRIDGVKASEAGASILDGEPVTLPRLVDYRADPLEYDLGSTPRREQPAARIDDASGSVMPRHTSLPPANWYPDPYYPSFLRYWDGAAWTEHTSGEVSRAQLARYF